MASDFDLDAAMTRLVQMEKEAVADVVGTAVDAKPYFPYQQEDFPYWTNRVVSMQPTFNFGQDIARYDFQIGARLVLGHWQKGYDGAALSAAWNYIPPILNYFKNRPYLTNSVHTTKLDDIWTPTGEGAEIINLIGPAAFSNGGIGAIDVGVEFTILLPFIVQVF